MSESVENSKRVSAVRRVIIMPAHNEANNLPHVVAALRQAAIAADLVVVDDGSRDETAGVARRLGARVVSLPVNLGYGGAVQAGFRFAVQQGYDIGILMDADGQHDPASIPALLAPVEQGQADLALGSRFLGRLEYQTSGIRRFGMRLFSQIVSRVTRQSVTDPTSGFQAMNREVMTFFARDNYPTDFPDADTILLLHFAGFRLVEVPVTMRGRISGVSMHANLKPIYYIAKMFLSILIVLLRQRTNGIARVTR